MATRLYGVCEMMGGSMRIWCRGVPLNVARDLTPSLLPSAMGKFAADTHRDQFDTNCVVGPRYDLRREL